MGVNELYLFPSQQTDYLLLYAPVKGFERRNNMTLDTHLSKPVNHLASSERQGDWLELLFIQIIDEVKKMRLSSTYLPLADDLQNFYPAHLFFTRLSSESL